VGEAGGAEGRIFPHSFQPAASPTALQPIGRDIRSWALHHRSGKSLTELAQMYNPCIRGWIIYYSHFYKTQLRPTLKRIDAYVIRWARRKFKGCATRPRVQEIGLTGSAVPIQHSSLIGRYVMATAEHRSRVNREVHARFWERPEVKLLRATRH
jgi:hypothetical protein